MSKANVKFMLLGDIHLCKKFARKFAEASEAAIAAANEQKPDFIVVAGDLFNGSILMEDPAVGLMSRFLKQLARVSPIVGIYGTLSHDVPGILDVYNTLRSNTEFPVLLASTPMTVALFKNGSSSVVPYESSTKLNKPPVAYVSLLPPFPLPATANDPIRAATDKWITTARIMKELVIDDRAPHVLVSHVSTDFCGPIRTGVVIPAASIPKFDFVALGHEHTAPQSGNYPNIHYSGSLFHTEANDLTVRRIKFITLGDRPAVDTYPLPSRPYARKTVNISEIDTFLQENAILANIDTWITVEVPSDCPQEAVETARTKIREALSEVQIKFVTIPPDKTRLPELPQQPTFVDKFSMWASSQTPPITVTPTILEKLERISELGNT